MPYSYEIDVDRRLVIVAFTGNATIADVEAIMAELYADPRHSFALGRAYDVRGVTRLPAIGELRRVAELFQTRVEMGSRPRRAIIVREGVQYGLGRMFQTLLDLVGLELNVFTDVETAITWVTDASRSS